MTQRSKAHEAKNERHNAILAFYSRLHSFFIRHTTFNIRWKKNWYKDFIAPGVFTDEFLKEFTRGELKKMVLAKLVSERSYTDGKTGSRRAAVLFIDYEMPQVERFNKFATWLLSTDRMVWRLRISIAIVFIALIALIVMAPWKKAFGFGPSLSQPNLQSNRSMPGTAGFFDDTEIKVRCYWMSQTDRPALSCVKR